MAILRPLLSTTGLALAVALSCEARAEEPEPEPAVAAAAAVSAAAARGAEGDVAVALARPAIGSSATPYLTGAIEPSAPALQLRWWVRRGAADVGIGLGLGPSLDTSSPGLAGPMVARPGLSLGWRGARGHTLLYADAGPLAAPLSGAPGAIGARVGVEWAPAKALPMGLDKGLLGVRLDSGYRLSVRPRRGGLAFYVRGQF